MLQITRNLRVLHNVGVAHMVERSPRMREALLIILDVCHQDISWTYLSRYKHSEDISTIEISLQSLICLIFPIWYQHISLFQPFDLFHHTYG